MTDLIYVSHLRRNRQKQKLSRLARRVLFVELLVDEPQPRFDLRRESDTLTVVQLAYGADLTTLRMLCLYLMREGYNHPLLWLDTPMGLEVVESIPYELLIYEVHDLDAAAADFPERESVLLRHANLVFTHTNALYQTYCRHNPHTVLLSHNTNIAAAIRQRLDHIYSGEQICH